MFAIACDFLTGRYVATAYNNRDASEWPPHPARLFSALVDSWASGSESGPEREEERQALHWLEAQPPPTVYVSEADARTVNTVFVPVNDVATVKAPSREKLDAAVASLRDETDAKRRAALVKDVVKLERKLQADTVKAIAAPTAYQKKDSSADRVLPTRRAKRPRTFPSITPRVPRVIFAWSGDPGAVKPLRRLLARTIRLGHSSSFVHSRVIETASDLASKTEGLDAWEPDAVFGATFLRWVSPGQLDRLVAAFGRHAGVEPRVLPALPIAYRRGAPTGQTAEPRSDFDDDLIVLARVNGPRLPSISAAGVSRQFRRALMAAATQPVSELISGHAEDGSPSERGHVAVVPLPHVFGPNPDGSLLGIGLVLPRNCPAADRRALAQALGRLEKQGPASRDPGELAEISLRLGGAGVLALQRLRGEAGRLFTLRSTTWSGPASEWRSATPMALDRHPGDLAHPSPDKRREAFAEAESSVLAAVARLGIDTADVTVEVSRSCLLAGTTKPTQYPRFPATTARPQRLLVHVRIVFPRPVRGPIILGAGRYHGLGLMAPVDGPRRRPTNG
jgi:CRISPR-associated protein Csb2